MSTPGFRSGISAAMCLKDSDTPPRLTAQTAPPGDPIDTRVVEGPALGPVFGDHSCAGFGGGRMSRVPWNFGGGPVSIRLRSRLECCSRFRWFRRRHAVPAMPGGRVGGGGR